MGEIASAIIAGITFLVEKLTICYSHEKIYRRNRDSLAEKASTLRARRDDMERRLRAATDRDELVRSEATDWVTRADKLLMKAMPSDSDAAEKTSRGSSYFCWRCDRIERAEALAESLDAILAEPPLVAVSDARSQPSVEQWRSGTGTGTVHHESFEEATAKAALSDVRRALSLAGVSIVGVFGTGGVGKTTLVSEVKRRAEAEGLYGHVVFATVSKPPNPEKIQNQIADSFGMFLGADQSRERRAAQIAERIQREKRVLIVLDDLWEALALRDIGVPSGAELAKLQSKIVITTRNEHVCNRMKCQKKIRVETWPESESRHFFKRTAGTEFGSGEFGEIADSVADECGGLPLALVAVANALGDKDIDEWRKALRRLRLSRPPSPDDDGRVYKSIKLSYNYLKKDEQMCFLICCLFPEDHNIENEEMARYVFGLGLFREANTVEEARGETETIVKKLMASGLLLDGDKKEQVKMHDVIRDVAIQITSETLWIDDPESNAGENNVSEERQVFMVQTGNHPLKEWPIRETYESYTAISVMSHDIRTLPNGLVCQKLQMLLLQDNNNLEEIPATFFEKMNGLRVLDLSGIQSSSVPLSIKTLSNLRTLHLDRSSFTDVSVLGFLQQLAILSLRVSIMEEFPQDIRKLINLRILDLTMSHGIKIPPEVLSGFPNLEELYLRGSFAEWRTETDEETANHASFEEVINLPRVIVLNVDIEDTECLPAGVKSIPAWWKFDICVCREPRIRLKNIGVTRQRSAYSRNLMLDTSMKHLPDWFVTALAKTEKLKYTLCEELNLLEEHDHGFLASLKSLVIEDCQELENVMHRPEDGSPVCGPVFEGLEELRIHDMGINDICVGELPADSLKSLKLLEIQQCDSLTGALLPPDLVKRLRNLERLLASTISVEEVFGFDNLGDGLYLGRLREIRLFDMYELKHLWRGKARLADFSKLTSVSVIKCEKLSHLFSVSITEGLSNLTELWIEECAAMKEIVRDEEGISLKRIKFPELKALCLVNLPKLSVFYAGKGVLECPSLENLHVWECSELRAPASSFNSLSQIQENDEHHMKILSKRLKKPEY